MSVLDRKLLRELRGSAGLLLAIACIILVGIQCFVSMRATYNNLNAAKRSYYAQCRMADFTVELKKAPLAEIERLRSIPGVTDVRTRIQFFATVDLDRVAEPLNGFVLSLPDRRRSTINDIVLRQGGYFTDVRANEVIVNEAFARRHGLYPGQWIHLLLNNRRQELFIVGTAISSEFTYLVAPGSMVPDAARFGVFYLKQTYMEEIFDFDGAANQVLGELSPAARDNPHEVLRRAELMLDNYGVLYTTPQKDQASNRFLTNEIEGMGTFAFLMPAIFLAVAAIVLNMLMSRLTEQQRVVVGTLKALGYSNRQIFWHFLKFGLTIGLGGGITGCILGHWFAGLLVMVYQQVFQFPDLRNGNYPWSDVQAVLISAACAISGAMLGTRAVLKLHPAEAMRPKPPAQGGAIWLERIPHLWQRLSFGWRMTLRNVVRHKLRTFAGMFAAMMGAAIMFDAFMMQRAVWLMIDFQFEKVLRSDMDLTFKDERGRDALIESRSLPGVDAAEPTLSVGCTFTNGSHSYKGAITGLLPGARMTVPRAADGHPIRVPSAGCNMTQTLADMLHLKKGDMVTFRPSKGLRQEVKIPVVEISDSYLGLSVYTEIEYLSRLINEEFAMTGVQLGLHPGQSERASLYHELKQTPSLQAVSERRNLIHNLVETLVKTQRVFIWMLVAFAGVIFFGSVLNTSLISLAERQREVGTLRVLGYTPWQIGGLFLRESLVINVLGTILGLPVGYLLTWLTTEMYGTEMFRIPIPDPRDCLLQTLVLGAVFGLSAHAFVQRAIFQLNWVDALKTRE